MRSLSEHPLAAVALGAVLGAGPTLASVYLQGNQERTRALAEHRTEAVRDSLRSCSNLRVALDDEIDASEVIVRAAKKNVQKDNVSHDELVRLEARLDHASNKYRVAEQEFVANLELTRLKRIS